MTRSLLDRADLGRLRAQLSEAASHSPSTAVLTLLLEAGVVQHDPGDPAWPDRDRLVLGGRAVMAGAPRAFTAAGYRDGDGRHEVPDGRALAVAQGAAVSSRLDGGVARVWCVLDRACCRDGVTWEAAAAARPPLPLTALVIVEAGDDLEPLAARWRACGWSIHHAAVTSPELLLGACDQALADAGPSLVLVA